MILFDLMPGAGLGGCDTLRPRQHMIEFQHQPSSQWQPCLLRCDDRGPTILLVLGVSRTSATVPASTVTTVVTTPSEPKTVARPARSRARPRATERDDGARGDATPQAADLSTVLRSTPSSLAISRFGAPCAILRRGAERRGEARGEGRTCDEG